jgi:hypothetical protein
VKNILRYIRKHYDKILHISVSMNIVFILNKYIQSIFFLFMSIFVFGLLWEITNWYLFNIKKSIPDIIANLVGTTIAILFII